MLCNQASAGELIGDTNGCKVWIPYSYPGISVTWAGQCPDGLADGTGVLHFFEYGRPTSDNHGKRFRGYLDEQKALTSSNPLPLLAPPNSPGNLNGGAHVAQERSEEWIS